ncbi:hypothetical protein NEMBOFW57_010333 [Staphylotrichum longicolle]|uniref:Uncharacterized protein n=1 Tax=Staphylotrichum longicolle TaxID=669026 RepID=A0AAD4EMX2_9PEZI|nr:hypothetical protein NEMBOFW57_010333 [Staphylotrichum longicolle]
MKTSSAFTLITSLLAVAVYADVTWFDPIHDITCTGHADGTITCQKGHAAEHANTARAQRLARAAAPPVTFTTGKLKARQGGDDASAVCTGAGEGKALGCFLSCFGQGFCKARCDAQDACQCSEKDASGNGNDKGGLICEKRSG